MTEAGARGERKYHVIIWGATGFTGRLVSEFAARFYGPPGRGLSYAIAGRTQARLQEVAALMQAALQESHGVDANTEIPMIIASADDAESMRAMAKQCACVCALAGPYVDSGEAVLQACVAEDTDYVDITGEILWVKAMAAKYGADAKRRGLKVVPCCGYDFVPMDMSVFELQSKAKDALSGRYCDVIKQYQTHSQTKFSGGTARTILKMMAAPFAILKEYQKDPYSMCPTPPPNVQDLRALSAAQAEPRFPSWDTELRAYVVPNIMTGAMARFLRWSNYSAGYPYGERFVVTAAQKEAGLVSACLSNLMLYVFTLFGFFSRFFGGCVHRMLPPPGKGMSRNWMDRQRVSFLTLGTLSSAAAAAAAAPPPKFWCKMDYSEGDAYKLTAIAVLEAAACLALDKASLPPAAGVLPASVALGHAYTTRLARRSVNFHVSS
eukprot:GHVU01040954.1.p1 GENE.GHVU01040954.1~~GHVU01040954.1.p1  ORF type:complete len:437 (+),score=92.16 GHVU01040954.1:362-1672(+)